MSDAIQIAIETLTELKRLHQLNFELLEQLNITCQWIIDNIPEIPNANHFRSLLGKSLALMTEIQAKTPKILQYQKLSDESLHHIKSDKDFTEPYFRFR